MSDNDSFAPAVEHHYGPIGRLYHGLTTVDFVGRRKIWFSVSLTIIVLGIASLGVSRIQLRYRLQGRQFVGSTGPSHHRRQDDERR